MTRARGRRILVRAWAAPCSLAALPLAAAAVLTGGRARMRDGVLEAWGGMLGPVLARAIPGFPICAITLGHVVLACDVRGLEATRAHERAHVAQYETWGPLMPLLYVASSAAALLRGRRLYADNVFERDARARSGESHAA